MFVFSRNSNLTSFLLHKVFELPDYKTQGKSTLVPESDKRPALGSVAAVETSISYPTNPPCI